MKLAIPDMALVALVGVSGSGKSTFAAKHFRPTQVLSSDFFRGLVSDDENDQSASAAAFDALHYVAAKRLAAGQMTVIDATNTQREPRKTIVELARKHHVLPVAIVLDMPETLCAARNTARPDRDFGAHVIRRQRQELRKALKTLDKEGFRRVHVLHTPEEVEAAEIVIEPLLNDKRAETGPFDVIGDVHGCRAELEALLDELGYVIDRDADGRAVKPLSPGHAHQCRGRVPSWPWRAVGAGRLLTVGRLAVVRLGTVPDPRPQNSWRTSVSLTRPSFASTPSARNSSSCRVARWGAGRPDALMTRCHGRSDESVRMIQPTMRGLESPAASAISP